MTLQDDNVDLAKLAEDVDELKANDIGFAAQLETHTRMIEQLRDAPGGETADEPPKRRRRQGGSATSTDDGNAEASDDEEETPAAPPFILSFDEDSPEYRAEVVALDAWVRLVLSTYLRPVSSSLPWCDQWFQHPEAVARLHALWLAWQQYTDPEAGGWDGPSVWHRDHLDPCLSQLRSNDGPFSTCGTNPNRISHRERSYYDMPPFAPLPFTADEPNEP